MDKMATHYRTCNLCEAMCGLEIKVRGEEILSIKGDKADPFSRGHICPKAIALQDIYHDPDRLRYPVRRTETGWEQISWEEAYDEVVTNLQAVQKAHGRNAVGVYQGNPNVHNLGSILCSALFVRALRTKNRFSATSSDQLPHHFAALLMFGHYFLLPVPDVDRTDFMLMLGANPLASNGSIMTAGGIERRLKEVQARGGQVVTVDPRRTETARLADDHVFIRPGTDALFLLAMLHVIFEEGWVDLGALGDFSDNLAVVAGVVGEFSPESVAEVTGVGADKVRALARAFCEAESAVCYGRIGTSTQAFGGLCNWLTNVLNIVTGNFDRPGGAMFTLPAVDVVDFQTRTGRVGARNRWQSRVRGLPEFAGELPAAVMAEELLTEGEGQIKAMVTIAGNPVLSTPNGGQLDGALAGLDYMVAVDIYINETTRHANIILPPTTGLETAHYDLVFHALAVRNTAKYSEALFDAPAGTKHDWQIFQDLGERLTKPRFLPRKLARLDLTKRLPPHRVIDLGLRFGPYGWWGGNKDKRSLSLAKLRRAPHGIDLGALEGCLPGRLPTGRIDLAPALIVADLARLRTFWANAGQNGQLLLIGRRQLRSNNSWMHNSERLVRGKRRCTVLMHPQDAEERGIADGVEVVVKSRVGEVRLPVVLSEEMMAGVVSIPHGWGHARPGVRMGVAQAHAGVSVNDLTDELAIDELTGNAAFSGVGVVVYGD